MVTEECGTMGHLVCFVDSTSTPHKQTFIQVLLAPERLCIKRHLSLYPAKQRVHLVPTLLHGKELRRTKQVEIVARQRTLRQQLHLRTRRSLLQTLNLAQQHAPHVEELLLHLTRRGRTHLRLRKAITQPLVDLHTRDQQSIALRLRLFLVSSLQLVQQTPQHQKEVALQNHLVVVLDARNRLHHSSTFTLR